MFTSINWDDFNAYISQYSEDIQLDMIRYIAGQTGYIVDIQPDNDEALNEAMLQESTLAEEYNHCKDCNALYTVSHICDNQYDERFWPTGEEEADKAEKDYLESNDYDRDLDNYQW